MNQIELVALPDDQLTAYIAGGRTRHNDLSVPHFSQVLTVARAGRGPSWRLAKGAAAALAALQLDLEAQGAEAVRLSDAFRQPDGQQAVARAGYEAWLAAGLPKPSDTLRWRADMKTAYVARPGESNHGWGGSKDIDVGALVFPGVRRGSDEALDEYWTVARRHGWTPIIAEPDVTMAECWHFDHLGPLADVRKLYLDAGYRRPAAYVARVGCALAGTLPSTVATRDSAYVQARLLIAGHFAGVVDGQVGPKTREAMKAAGLAVTAKTSVPQMVVLLNEAGTGVAQIEQL